MAGSNPALVNWTGPMGLPDFAAIKPEDFAAGFESALAAERLEVDGIADSGVAPTFDNTIAALERSGNELSRVSSIFWNLTGVNSDPVLRETERAIAPKLSHHNSQTYANPKLFQRIDALWQDRANLGLDMEQERVLERIWTAFVRGGAALEAADQQRLAAVNARLAELGAAFSQNILADESNWYMHLETDEDVEGLPGFLKNAMKAAAAEKGLPGGYAVTLSRSIIEPFLSSSPRRDLRETAFAAWSMRGENAGDTDNRPLVKEIVNLRREKADLLGYDNFACMKLENQMAKSPERVVELLEQVWDKAKYRASEEEAELADKVAATGANHPVKPWDWRYFSEQVIAEKFDFDDAELKPYLSLDAMIAAAFDVAHRLFGITVEERPDIAAHHPDARVFEVLNTDGSHRAVFVGDYFARSSKRSGAWMSNFQGQHKLDGGQSPIIINVMNFAKAPAGEPCLLSLDDARTLFHEFGHALHGILSDVTYPSVSGTSVARDFVELPSQLFEHWLMVPDILFAHARHVETGEPIPQPLLDKVLSARQFNAGFAAVEFTASALVDMAFHTSESAPDDVIAFEAGVLDRLDMPDAIAMRHRTPHFAHVFSGDGYSAGYYSYMWSEVLDADAFAAFEETGDVFDKSTAQKLLAHIYSAGGSIDPEETYLAFRGKMPSPAAMLEKRGLVKAGAKAA